jgi:heterodisulfide reductase subunit C
MARDSFYQEPDPIAQLSPFRMPGRKTVADRENGNQTSFFQRVMADTPGGEALRACLQCGTCGGSCPSAADMDATPRRLFAMIAADMEDEVLRSNTPWYCVNCYYCMVRCPQEIPITDLMYTLKRMSIAKGNYHKDAHPDWSNSFIGYVEQYGRSFEFGLATRYHLVHHPLSMISKSELGFEMMHKGRLNTMPERIKNMPQLTAILNEAERIAAHEEV